MIRSWYCLSFKESRYCLSPGNKAVVPGLPTFRAKWRTVLPRIYQIMPAQSFLGIGKTRIWRPYPGLELSFQTAAGDAADNVRPAEQEENDDRENDNR